MSGDFVSSIEKLLKAYENGIKLAKRVSRRSTFAAANQVLQIQDSGRSLQGTLDQCIQAICTEYAHALEICGQSFSHELAEDVALANRLKELRVQLLDQINECPDFDDGPDHFDPAGFVALAQHATKCCTECIEVFESARQHVLRGKGTTKVVSASMVDDPGSPTKAIHADKFITGQESRAELPAHIGHLLLASPPEQVPPMRIQIPWAVATPVQPQSNAGISATSQAPCLRGVISPISSSDSQAPTSRGVISPISPEDDHHPRFKASELVVSRISANDDFLERRRHSRTNFQRESLLPIHPIVEDQAHETFESAATTNSPVLGYSDPGLERLERQSPTTSSSGYDSLVTRERSLGHNSQGTMSSRGSSLMFKNRPRGEGEDTFFGFYGHIPASPPLSHKTSSSTDHNGNAMSTGPRLPHIDTGIESGLEVVSVVDAENVPRLASEDEARQELTPAPSIKSVEHRLRPDCSFYKFGGFCEGAKSMTRGETGFKVVKKVAHHVTTLSAKCIKCAYEVSWDDLEKDRMLDREGVYTSSGIKWRQKFVSKCHLKTSSVEEPNYACPFCIQENKTVHEHDATVFFTVNHLFRHLAKHDTPVVDVPGIITIYGTPSPAQLDFDINFTTDEPRPVHYSIDALGDKVTSRASAFAITTHRPKPFSKSSRDPEGNPTMQYAEGARFVGLAFPDHFNGQFCIAYHDNIRGSLPLSTIALDLPGLDDANVKTDPASTLIATAKWDFKPRSTGKGNKNGVAWLRFNRGDRISCVAYNSLDDYCWSGSTGKEKFGVFPAAFVDGLVDARIAGTSVKVATGVGENAMSIGEQPPISPTSPTRSATTSTSRSASTSSRLGGLGLGALGSRMVAFPLRKRSTHLEREKEKAELERSNTVSSSSAPPITPTGGGSPLKAATVPISPSAAIPTIPEVSIGVPLDVSTQTARVNGIVNGDTPLLANPQPRIVTLPATGKGRKRGGSKGQGQAAPRAFERNDRYM